MFTGVMNPVSMVNNEMVNLAIDIATPSIKALLNIEEPIITSKDRVVAIVVKHPDLESDVTRVVGRSETTERILQIANWKSNKSASNGFSTAELTFDRPWDHKPGDFLYPGSAVSGSLSVGSSGLKGYGDEIVSNMILKIIEGLCKLKRDELYAADIKQLVPQESTP